MSFLKANFLNYITIHYFPSINNTNNTILIVGGMHGDEKPCVKGAELLKEYLTQPDTILSRTILENTTIVIVPLINRVGYLADARSCPTDNAEINYEDGKIVINDDEKGMYKFPPNWQDPNRGWDENYTLVKKHLERLISVYKPSYIIFDHDWALPQARIKIYGKLTLLNNISRITELLERFYPAHNAVGKSWSFLHLANQNDEDKLSFQIYKKYRIPNFLTETYFVGKQSPKIHLVINLFLIIKLGGVQIDDSSLINFLIKEHDIQEFWFMKEF